MAGKIFINYRRVESQKDALHLKTVFDMTFGDDRVFLDVSGIDGGANWLHTLERQVAASAAMVVLIGENWADLKDDDGNRRLDNPNDFVRVEISQALLRGLPIVPVSIDGATVPKPAQLPGSLMPLSLLQAMPLRAQSFRQDAKAIAERLKAMLAQRKLRKQGLPAWAAGLGLAAALAAGVAAGPMVMDRLGLLGVALPPGESAPQWSDIAAQIERMMRRGGDAEKRLVDAERAAREAQAAQRFLSEQLVTVVNRQGEAGRRIEQARLRLVAEQHKLEAILTGKGFIATLTFVDAKTRSVLATGDANLIDKVVEDGAITVSVVNLPGHILKNNDANAQEFNRIFFDANLSRSEKTEKIVNELMVPNEVDGLISGQFLENADGTLSVRPFAITAKDKKLVTESLVFRKEEFKCPDRVAPKITILCDKARADLHDAVVRITKALD